jgi:hypothetical protein
MANKNSETREDATQLERQLNRIRYTEALGRRGFLRNVGLAGVSVAAGSILTSCLGSNLVERNSETETVQPIRDFFDSQSSTAVDVLQPRKLQQ